MNRPILSLASALLIVGSCSSGPDHSPRTPDRFPTPVPVEATASESAAPAASTGRGDILPYDATETTLANGLKVIVVPTGYPNLVTVQIPVQTGSRNEVEEGKTGFAHFFEHMMFRGTEKFPPADYEAIITKAGARQNAYTTDDYTNYHVTFAKEDLDKVLEIEADRFMNLNYSEDQFRTEARAVLGEYNKNFANPIQKLFEVISDEAYSTHTYKHTTMGFLEDIMAMPDQMEYAATFFDRWYRPEYTTVIVAGDVVAEDVIPMVEKYWGMWERGSYEVEIPQETSFSGPKYKHVAWADETNALVTVNFHGPAMSETEKDAAAIDMLNTLYFGSTSDLYRKLVLAEQKVDLFGAFGGGGKDPSLVIMIGRLFDEADALFVRDEILRTVALAKSVPVSARRLEEAKANARYGFARGLDNSDAIGSTLAQYVQFDRSYDTINNVYRLYDSLTPQDLLDAARKYYTDERMVVTTLSSGDALDGMDELPTLASLAPTTGDGGDLGVGFLMQPSQSPQLSISLLFHTGSADDPEGKEGLAALSAAMISDGGSADMRYEEIQKALFPVAGGFGSQVDREMTVFGGSIHRDNVGLFADTALAQLFTPGFREEDFKRVKDSLRNALVQDLRTSNEEELGKEALQRNIFAGTSYGHPTQGTVAGIDSITLDDVKQFVATHYTRSRLTVGLAGDVPDEFDQRLRRELAGLPLGEAVEAAAGPQGRMPEGIEVEIIEKEALATAISFGFPIEVTRAHEDFVALNVARAWLGEHRSSMSHLYQRIREIRGMNYGDYAYIEAFPNGGRQFFPSANIARKSQLFEIWIRPVRPEHAHHALRIAIHELEQLVNDGLTEEQFESTREYLSKNVFLLTSTQSQNLGYALDSRFYGIGDYTEYVRSGLERLTAADVNAAIKRHLQAENLSVVMITKDAAGLKEALLSDAVSTMTYESEKPAELLAEDEVIGARKLNIDPSALRVTPVTEVFAD